MSIWGDHLLLAATSLVSLLCVYYLPGLAGGDLLDRLGGKDDLRRPDRICRALILGFIPASLIARALLTVPDGFSRLAAPAACALGALFSLYLLLRGRSLPPAACHGPGVSAATLACWMFFPLFALDLISRWLSAPKIFDVAQMWVYQGYLQGADIVGNPGPDPGLLLRFGWHYGAFLLSGAYFNHNIFPLLNSGSFVFIPAAFFFLWSAAVLFNHVFGESRASTAALFIFTLLFACSPTHEYLMMNKGPVLSLSLFFASLAWFIRYRQSGGWQPLFLCGMSLGLTSDTGLTGMFFGGLYYSLFFVFSRDKAALIRAAVWTLLCLALCVIPLRISIGAMESAAFGVSAAACLIAWLAFKYSTALGGYCLRICSPLLDRARILAPISVALPLLAMTFFAYPQTPWHGGHFSWYAFGFWGVFFGGYSLVFTGACLFMALALFLRRMKTEAEYVSPLLILCFVLPALTYLSALPAVWDLSPQILRESVLKAMSRYWPPTILDLSRSLHLYFLPLSFSLATAILLARLCLLTRLPRTAILLVTCAAVWIWGLGHDPVPPATAEETGKYGWNATRHSSMLELFRPALHKLRQSAQLLAQFRRDKEYRPLLLWDNPDQLRLLRFLAPRYLGRNVRVYFDLPAPGSGPPADEHTAAFHAWRIQDQVIGPRYMIFDCNKLPPQPPEELYVVSLGKQLTAGGCPALSCANRPSLEGTWELGPYFVRRYRCRIEAH